MDVPDRKPPAPGNDRREFAESYETVDLSQWIAGQPADVLAVNCGRPAATFADFPKRDVFMAGG